MDMIITENLKKIYGKGNTQVEALKGINLKIEQGQFVSVMGASGSGKSTLLHILGGVDRPTSGKIYVGGEDVYSLKEKQLSIFRRRRVGFVFQFFNLIPVLTAKENIILPILLDGEKVDEQYFNDLINILGLKGHENRLPSQLSGGQQQRVSIARAMSCRPSIILADEPTGNLDKKNGKEVMDLLKMTSRKFGQTLILITHDMEMGSRADRIITLEDGMILGDEAVAQ